MERKKSLLIKSIIFLLNLIVFLIFILLYFYKYIIFEVFLALVFIQFFVSGLSLFLYLIYKKFQKLAKELNFKYLKGSFPHPKFEGYYKNNWFQLHFVSRDYGSNWGKPMLYVKLQYKKLMKFDESKLKKYANFNFHNHKIIEIKHIIRDYKNYLLLKREWPIFNKTQVYELMDFLLKVAKEAEIKDKT